MTAFFSRRPLQSMVEDQAAHAVRGRVVGPNWIWRMFAGREQAGRDVEDRRHALRDVRAFVKSGKRRGPSRRRGVSSGAIVIRRREADRLARSGSHYATGCPSSRPASTSARCSGATRNWTPIR